VESSRIAHSVRARFLAFASVVLVALCLGATTIEAAPPPVVLKMARYAVATATHDHPSHVVTAADVSNAADTFNLDGETDNPTDGLSVLANLGELPGYPRTAALISSTTFEDICVNFPDTINGTPTVLSCPRKALEDFANVPLVLIVSRDAVKTAALRGRAVAGVDVVKAAAVLTPVKLALANRPTFKAGQGGNVVFAFAQGDICVHFPKTAYGIPYRVAC
jgi:hypothetical protein